MRKRTPPRQPDLQFPFPVSSAIELERLLAQTAPVVMPELIDSALSQIGAGLGNLRIFSSLARRSQQYERFIRWAYRFVSETMSPGEMTDSLREVAITAMAMGWMACGAGIQSNLLGTIVSQPFTPAASAPEPPSQTRKSRRKAGQQ